MTKLYRNLCYNKVCYKGTLMYLERHVQNWTIVAYYTNEYNMHCKCILEIKLSTVKPV